jgi:hypothetical protein
MISPPELQPATTMTLEIDPQVRYQQNPSEAAQHAAVRAMVDYVVAAASWAAVMDKTSLLEKAQRPPAEAKMRACALTAITLMHRSGLVTIQPASEDPAADASVEAINTVFSSMMRTLSRPPRGWMIETPLQRRVMQDAVAAFRK